MQEKDDKKASSWWEVIKTFFWALVIAIVFKSFVFQPFNIPSGSMKPTLLVGDYLMVSKYSYGYSKHSFPMSPNIFSGRVLYHEPQRGDIVVFFVPQQTIDKDTYIKRLIGLPGDEIQVKKGVLYINGQATKREDDGVFYDRDVHYDIKRLIETLPEGKRHWVLDDSQKNSNNFYGIDPNNTQVYKVPAGYFFMMGDNRDNSADSRFPSLGFVAQEDLIGRAEILVFASGESWNPLKWDYKRFFTLLR